MEGFKSKMEGFRFEMEGQNIHRYEKIYLNVSHFRKRETLTNVRFWRLVVDFPTRRSGFEHRPGYVGFVVYKVALGQGFSQRIGFPANSHPRNYSMVTITYHLGLVQ
jgi:hypothetical protein